MTDIGNVEVPVVEKSTRINEAIYSLVGSVTAENPVSRISKSRSFRDYKLDDIQRQSMEFIKKNTTPKELLEIIAKNPPPVFVGDNPSDPPDIIKPDPFLVTEADQSDKDIAALETEMPGYVYDNTTVRYLKMFLKYSKQYLESSKLVDTFKTSDDRRRWRDGVGHVFYMISEDFGNAFQDLYHKNRYSNNRMTALETMPSYFDDLPLPVVLRNMIDGMSKEFREARKNTDNGNINDASEILAEQSRRFVKFFSKKERAK